MYIHIYIRSDVCTHISLGQLYIGEKFVSIIYCATYLHLKNIIFGENHTSTLPIEFLFKILYIICP